MQLQIFSHGMHQSRRLPDFLDRGAPMELVVNAILDITDAEESVEMAQHRDEKLNNVRE
jgi:hypothetical protein